MTSPTGTFGSVFGSRGNRADSPRPSAPAPTAPAPAPTAAPAPTTTPTQDNALETLKQQLADWGIDSLYGDVVGYVTAGYDPDTINIRLQQTDAYKTRFKANADRKAKGLAVLSPAEYIATERQYRNIFQKAGLPAGFYDSTDDFTKFLGGDVSPTELNDRVNIAVKQWTQAPQLMRDVWQQEYGLNAGDAVASILDPDAAWSILERRAGSVAISTEAARNGLQYSAGRGESFFSQGVTADQARDGYSEIGQTLNVDRAIGSRFGQEFTQADAEDATLLGTASAKRKRDQGRSDEAANFRTGNGAGAGSLSANSNY